MSNLSNDPLSRFFRNLFREAEEQPGAWNTPPDSVYENAMVEIEAIRMQRRRARRRIGLLSLGGFIAVAILLAMHMHVKDLNNKVESLEEQITAMNTLPGGEPTTNSNNATSMSETAPAQNRNSQVTRYPVTKPEASKGEDPSQFDPLVNTAKTQTTAAKKAPNSIQTNTADSEMNDIRGGSTGEADRSVKVSRSSGSPSDRATPMHKADAMDKARIFSISLLESREQSVQTHLTPANAEMAIPSEVQSSTRRWSAGVLFSANFSKLTMDNIPDGPPTLTRYDQYYSGYGLQGLLEYRISNRLSGVFALGFSRVRNKSLLNDEMAYDSENITTDGWGNKVYSSECILQTPLGFYNTIVEFPADDLKANDGEMLKNATTVEQSLDIWTTSLGARYAMIKTPRFNAFAGAGLDYSAVVSSRHELHSDFFFESEFLAGVDNSATQLDKLSRSYFSLYGEVGAEYYLNSTIALSAAARYSQSITSLRQATETEPKTFLRQINISIGLQYKF